MIELRLRGDAAEHPASVVLPLLISDLPAFCRWRGEPSWDSRALAELVDVCDRLVVDSSEWRAVPASYGRLAERFEETAVSDIVWRRSLPWRERSPAAGQAFGRSNGSRSRGRAPMRTSSPAGCDRGCVATIALTRRAGELVTAVRVDGDAVEPPSGEGDFPRSDLLSAELDTLVRDPVYEAAVRAAMS